MRREAGLFRKLRIAALLGVLVVVLAWAFNDVRRRRARTRWDRSLNVALVLVREGEVSDEAFAALRERKRDLELHLAVESERHRGTRQPEPFHFHFYGPVDALGPLPVPSGEGVLDLARYAFDSWRYYRTVDARADLPWRAFDARIYLLCRPAGPAAALTVEGRSEQGGWAGSVEVDLDASMVDLALFVATHELMHTLGATDKYEPSGRILAPDGLADPGRSPLYPQERAEVMARNVALSESLTRMPVRLEELAVGAATAREIGWLPR